MRRRPHAAVRYHRGSASVRVRFLGPIAAEELAGLTHRLQRALPAFVRLEVEDGPAPCFDLDALARAVQRKDAGAAVVLHDALLALEILGEDSTLDDVISWAYIDARPRLYAAGLLVSQDFTVEMSPASSQVRTVAGAFVGMTVGIPATIRVDALQMVGIDTIWAAPMIGEVFDMDVVNGDRTIRARATVESIDGPYDGHYRRLRLVGEVR